MRVVFHILLLMIRKLQWKDIHNQSIECTYFFILKMVINDNIMIRWLRVGIEEPVDLGEYNFLPYLNININSCKRFLQNKISGCSVL